MFLDYDIRGVYPKEVNEGLAQGLAEKFYNYLKSKKIDLEIFIGIDERKSSINLANAFSSFYTKLNNGEVKYLGVVSTPMFYYLCMKNKKAGVMITASHLPKNFNGFKFMLPSGLMWVYKSKIKKDNKNIDFLIKYKKIYLNDIYESYIKDLRKFYKISKSHFINFKKDLESPNYYLLKKLAEIDKKIVINKKAKLVVCSDLDGDRIWFNYKNKTLLPEQILYAILTTSKYKKVGIPITIHKKILEEFPNIKFIFIPTGHINFKKAWKKYNLDFGMESSFHYYFFKEMKTEAPILSLLKLLEFEEVCPLEEIIQKQFFVKRFNVKNIIINIDEIKKGCKAYGFKIKKFDGLYAYKKINKDSISFHIRKSKTEENVYRFFIESTQKNYLKLIENIIKKFFKNGTV